MSQGTYRVFFINNKVVFSIPLEPKNLKVSAYKYFPTGTIKKNLFRCGVKVLTRLNLEGLVSHTMENPIPMYLGFDFSKWKILVEILIGVKKCFAVVSFPSSEFRKRFYVHLINSRGENIAFAKVSRDSINDSFLRNEEKIMEDLNEGNFSFKVPNVISSRAYNNHQFILYEPMPKKSIIKNSKWEEYAFKISQELKKNTVSIKVLSETSWIEKLCKILSMKDLKDYFEANDLALHSDIKVCYSHGDLHNGNIRHYNDEVWVFDWESGCKDAPIMTDEISFYLGTIQKLFGRTPQLVYQNIYYKFICGKSSEYIRNVGLAFAFLCTMDRQDAKSVVLNWKYIKSGLE